MNRLLDELPSIFENLQFQDLLNCRLVNKRFRHFVDEAKIEELVVASSLTADFKRRWFGRKAMIDFEKYAISPNSFNGLKFVFNLNRHLKRLCLNFSGKLQMNLTVLDNMSIEQADIKCTYLGSSQAMKLPFLKVLELNIVNYIEYREDYKIFVRAPQLWKM